MPSNYKTEKLAFSVDAVAPRQAILESEWHDLSCSDGGFEPSYGRCKDVNKRCPILCKSVNNMWTRCGACRSTAEPWCVLRSDEPRCRRAIVEHSRLARRAKSDRNQQSACQVDQRVAGQPMASTQEYRTRDGCETVYGQQWNSAQQRPFSSLRLSGSQGQLCAQKSRATWAAPARQVFVAYLHSCV